MSVSLLEVIEAGGYNLNILEDAQWLVSKQREFERLIEFAEEVIEKAENEEDDRAEAAYLKVFPRLDRNE